MRVPHTFHLRCCASFIFYFLFLGFGLFHKVSSVSNRNGYPPDLLRRPRSIKKKTNSAHFNNKTIPFINRCTISCVDDLEGNHCGRCLRDLLFVLTTSCSLLRRISNRCSAGYCALVRLTKESLLKEVHEHLPRGLLATPSARKMRGIRAVYRFFFARCIDPSDSIEKQLARTRIEGRF